MKRLSTKKQRIWNNLYYVYLVNVLNNNELEIFQSKQARTRIPNRLDELPLQKQTSHLKNLTVFQPPWLSDWWTSLKYN